MSKDAIEEKTINQVNFEKLKELFPSAVSVDENGKYRISKEQLQMYIVHHLLSLKRMDTF